MNLIFIIKQLQLLFVAFLFLSCSTPQVKENRETSLLREKVTHEFESNEPRENEVFRIFLSSEKYIRKQIKAKDTIHLVEDSSGNEASSKELLPYDKINFKTRVIARITIYAESGTIAKIRFVRSSGISEIDKLTSEDITRWRFNFPTGKVEPLTFEITFYIFLKNKINKEQAKKELKKYVD